MVVLASVYRHDTPRFQSENLIMRLTHIGCSHVYTYMDHVYFFFLCACVYVSWKPDFTASVKMVKESTVCHTLSSYCVRNMRNAETNFPFCIIPKDSAQPAAFRKKKNL